MGGCSLRRFDEDLFVRGFDNRRIPTLAFDDESPMESRVIGI